MMRRLFHCHDFSRSALSFCFLALAAPACASPTPTQRDIKRVQNIADHAFHVASRGIASGPVTLQLRYNPCACDGDLVFEANIYGRWQYVRILAGRDTAAALIDDASKRPRGAFEATVLLNSVIYNAKSGQKYYTLQLPDDAVIEF